MIKMEKLLKDRFHEGNKNMNELQYVGRTISIVIGFCIYILIWSCPVCGRKL